MKLINNKMKILKSIMTKSALVFVSLVIATTFPMQIINNKAFAAPTVEELQAQIDALEKDIASYNAESARLSGQIDTLQSALAKLAAEKSVIQAQININQAKYDQLVIEIADTEKKIKDNQDALGTTLANMYVDDQITPLEMLASSNSIGDYLDKQEYRTSVRDQLTSTISTIKELKASLDKQKEETVTILDEQKYARQALIDKEAEQQNMLSQTQGQEAAYQTLATDSEAKRKELAQQQQDIIWAAQNQGGSISGIPDASKGNYPWGGNGCYVDNSLVSWGGDHGTGADDLGYACRQCTSYAAWKILEYTGTGYRNRGDASRWPYSFGQFNTQPRAHSVGVIAAGQYGHVVWVETDPDADGYIIISQYNDYSNNTGDNSGPGWGNYSKLRVHKSTYNYYIYF